MASACASAAARTWRDMALHSSRFLSTIIPTPKSSTTDHFDLAGQSRLSLTSRALDSPGNQCRCNRRGRDREGWQPNATDQRHGERGHEAATEDGTGDDLPITVASDDVRLPRRIDHVEHHEAAG